MSNYAAILSEIAISGSRKSDGTANAGGKVYAYLPDTLTSVNIYADAEATVIATQPITLDSGGRVPRTDYPDGLFTTQPVRLLIQDSAGSTVSDSVYVPSTAGGTGVSNAGFSDATLDAVLTDAFTSFGGVDWKYKESGGATARTVKAKFAEAYISVKDFGAVGDGVAIDTTAVQDAINRVKALGGGIVYFPPGTYKIDQALTVTSATGMTIRGAGIYASIVKLTHATANCFTVSGSNGIRFEDFDITHSSTSTGTGIATTTSSPVNLLRVGVGASNSTAVFANGVTLNAAGTSMIQGCFIYGTTNALSLTTCIDTKIYGGILSGTTYSIVFDGTTYCSLFGTRLADSGIARFSATLTGMYFTFAGCIVTSYSVATATIPAIRQFGGFPQASSTSSATGAAQTPSLLGGQEVNLTATSGGAGTVTVNNPAILPGSSGDDVNEYWDFVLKAAAGGDVTFDFGATAYKVSGGTTIVVTAAHTTSVRFRWDKTTSKLREVARADTVT